MGRSAAEPAKAIAELVHRGQIQTALRQLSGVHPPRMQRAVLKQLEPLLNEDDRRWFWSKMTKVLR